MTTPRTLPGLGLTGFWPLGADGWKDGMDANLRSLSALTQLAVLSRAVNLPNNSPDGAIYIVPHGPHIGTVAIRDLGAWVYLTPQVGWRAWVVDETLEVAWNGTAWVNLASVGGGGGGSVTTPVGIGTEVFIGTGSQTAFTLTGNMATATQARTFAFVDSAFQVPVNYTVTNGTITFVTAPPRNAEIVVLSFVSGLTDTRQEIATSVVGRPDAGGTLLLYAVTGALNLPLNAGQSRAIAGTTATATATFSIRRNGTQIGTLVFSAGQAAGVFTVTATSLVAGDVLSVVAPASQDTTLANVTITLLVER